MEGQKFLDSCNTTEAATPCNQYIPWTRWQKRTESWFPVPTQNPCSWLIWLTKISTPAERNKHHGWLIWWVSWWVSYFLPSNGWLLHPWYTRDSRTLLWRPSWRDPRDLFRQALLASPSRGNNGSRNYICGDQFVHRGVQSTNGS